MVSISLIHVITALLPDIVVTTMFLKLLVIIALTVKKCCSKEPLLASCILQKKMIIYPNWVLPLQVLSSAEVYHLQAAKWTATGSMNVQRYYFQMLPLLDGRVLAAGGVDENGDQVSSGMTSESVVPKSFCAVWVCAQVISISNSLSYHISHEHSKTM
jgi:hypothetical protein